MMFFPITTQASISVIIISVLVIIVGVVAIAIAVGFVLFVKYERPSISVLRRMMMVLMVNTFKDYNSLLVSHIWLLFHI